MHCDLVMRELSAPGGLDRSALADHLVSCPSCASWAEKVEKLDRIWEATRPAEPSSERFDATWSAVMARSESPGILAFVPRPDWKKWGLRAAACAQAAALLIGGLILLSTTKTTPVPAIASVGSVTGEEGKTLFVTLRDGQAPEVVESPQISESDTDMVSIDFDILGYMEAMR